MEELPVANEGFRASRAWIDAERAKIKSEMTTTEKREGADGVVAFLSEIILALPGDIKPEMQYRRCLAILEMFAWHERRPFLSAQQLTQLFATGYAILKTLGIGPPKPRLGFLFGEFKMAEARLAEREGRHLEAAWLSEAAQMAARRSGGLGPLGSKALDWATKALRRADGALAEAALKHAEEQADDASLRQAIGLTRLTFLRLSQRLEEADALGKTMMAGMILSEEGQVKLLWEEMCRDAQRGDTLVRMFKSVGRGGSHRESLYTLEATLWGRAISSRARLEQIPKLESIRKAFPDAVRRGGPLQKLFEAATALEKCYDNEIPMHLRLAGLGDVLGSLAALPGIDHEVLVWAAATRWLVRYQQYGWAAIAASHYEALSRQLSEGRSLDALSLKLDTASSLWRRHDEDDEAAAAKDKERAKNSKVSIDRIEESSLARTYTVAKASAELAAMHLKGVVKRSLADVADAERMKAEDMRVAAIKVVNTVGMLKGPILKAAQHFAGLAPDLPEEIRLALARSHEVSPGYATQQIRAVFQEELGMPVDKAFAFWYDTPIGTGSMGQVHRAVTHDGRDVVCKIQYPRMEQAVRSDLRVVRGMQPILRRFFPRLMISELISAYEASFLDELDYLREASLQEQSRAVTSHESMIVVPRTLPEWTSRRVLTMDFIEGKTTVDFLRDADEAKRREALSTILSFYFVTLIECGIANGDMHPGNFMFLRDGRVAFLDYGAAEIYPRERSKLWIQQFLGILHRDVELVVQSALGLKYIVNADEYGSKQATETIDLVSEILAKGRTLAVTREQLADMLIRLALKKDIRCNVTLPLSDVRITRGFLGIVGLFIDFKLEVSWGDLIMERLQPYQELMGKAS